MAVLAPLAHVSLERRSRPVASRSRNVEPIGVQRVFDHEVAFRLELLSLDSSYGDGHRLASVYGTDQTRARGAKPPRDAASGSLFSVSPAFGAGTGVSYS